GSAYQLTCYFTNWAQYWPGLGHFMTNDIDPCLCTHLIYAFAGMRNNEITTIEWDDVAFYQAFNGLKNKNSQLKILLAIGGWKFGTVPFTAMVSTLENHQTFIASVIKFLHQYEFDGLDFEWEYTGSYGSPPQDKHLFTVLLQEMREAFEQETEKINKPRLMITAMVVAGISNIQSSYEIPQLAQYLDNIHVMTYDLHGSWEGYPRKNIPLYKYPTEMGSNADLNVDYVMNYWKDNGAPAEKLIAGFPTYGHTFILNDSSNTGISVPTSGAGPAGPYARQAGFWAYYEICTFLNNGTTEAYQGNEWVGYDDIKSLSVKAQWLQENNFGGAMVCAIDLDDFTDTFCSDGGNLFQVHESVLLFCAISGCTAPAQPVEPITPPRSESGSRSSSSRGSSGGRGFCAGKANSLYPMANNKNVFRHCLNGVTYQQNFEAGLIFDTSCDCCNWGAPKN
uniref:chitinase n=1 Tax=Mustela putorius furo TaxID=9669 RepID=M3XYX0_MUSPF